jgi:hypothetical protein
MFKTIKVIAKKKIVTVTVFVPANVNAKVFVADHLANKFARIDKKFTIVD